MEETKIPAQRTWTVEETKIPHRPNSGNRKPRPSLRRDFRGAMVINPSFQRFKNEPVETVKEDEVEVQLMESPQMSHRPHRVAIKRENINVTRECQWDMKSIQDSNSSEKPSFRPKIIRIITMVICMASVSSLILTVLMLSGSLGATNCSCKFSQEGEDARAFMPPDEDDVENRTAWEKRLILYIEQRNEEKDKKFLEETKNLTTQLKMLKLELRNQKMSQENKTRDLSLRLELTQLELKSVKLQLSVKTAALWKSQNSTAFEVDKLQSVWTAINSTAEKTSNLTAVVDQEFKNVKKKINATNENLTKLTSSVKDLKLKIDEKMETIWLNVNQSKKCCKNLTTFFHLFKAKVTYRSLKLEARIGREEQNSNSTKLVTDKHYKKIKDLEYLMNATREEAKEANLEHLTALWSAGNLTMKEFRRVWSTVNASQVVLSEKLRKVRSNFTQQLNLTAMILRSSDASLFASLKHMNLTITEKVNNVSKMAGPIGPRGFNGSRGAPGLAGSAGPPGPKGSGDFSKCHYKTSKGEITPGLNDASTFLDEPNDKRVIGAACSANFGAENNLLSTVNSNVRRYVCNCRKTSPHYGPPSGEKGACFLHYWECPLTN
ncbi:uncharacterized protein [Montipora foliosa]